MPRLEDLSGQLDQPPRELTDRPIYIGRDPSVCELCFPNHIVAVSRIHASVRWDAALQKVVLRDEGSMNGTYLHGEGKPLIEGEDIPIDVGQGFYLAQTGIRLRIVR